MILTSLMVAVLFVKINKANSFTCTFCGESFESKTELMVHRKTKHKSKVRMCTNFMQNNCKFESKACWYSHDEEEMDVDEDIGKKIGNYEEDVSEAVFQRVRVNLRPPIIKQKKD